MPELYALEVTECCEEAGKLRIALLFPLPSANPSKTALLYHGMQIFPRAVLFPLTISNMSFISGFFIWKPLSV